MGRLVPILTALVVCAATVIFFMPGPAGVSANTMHAASLVALAVGLWAAGSVPEYMTGLIFFLLAMLFSVAPANVVFSGFASGTLWLVLGGLIIAEGVNRTGLGERFARFLIGRFQLTYRALIVAIVIVSSALCFVMPATIGRVLLLIPVIGSITERLGLPRGSAGHNGAMLATILTSYQVGTSILPSNAPNLVLAGAAETLYRTPLIYAEYLLVQFPVMGLLKAATIIVLTWLIFPDRTKVDGGAVERKSITSAERRLTVILVVALVLWATDFIHHIHPGWIALSAALAAMLPGIGVMPVTAFAERIKFGPFFYIAAVLGLGSVMTHTGVSEMLGKLIQTALHLRAGHDALNFTLLTLLSTFAGVVVTNVAQPALLAPLAGHFAEVTGWPLKAALMTMALGFTTLIMPFQVPPVMVGVQVAGLRLGATLRLTVPLILVSLLILLPLDYLWWRLIGYFD